MLITIPMFYASCIFVWQNGQRRYIKDRMVRMERLLAPVPIPEYRRNPPTLATRLCKSIFWRILRCIRLFIWMIQTDKKNINNILHHHNTVGTSYTIVHIHYTIFVNNSLSCLNPGMSFWFKQWRLTDAAIYMLCCLL